jgi:hypothetical protein
MTAAANAAEVNKHFCIIPEDVDEDGLLPAIKKRKGDPRLECKYCKKVFYGGVCRSRGHLTGAKGSGVTTCPSVPEDVKAAFMLYEEEAATEKKRLASVALLDNREASGSTVSVVQRVRPDGDIRQGLKVQSDLQARGNSEEH